MSTPLRYWIAMTLKRRRVRKLIANYGMTCAYCTAELNRTIGHARQLTLDHRVPRVQGGSNRLSNLALACATCNRRKGARSAAEYLADARFLGRRATITAEHVRQATLHAQPS